MPSRVQGDSEAPKIYFETERDSRPSHDSRLGPVAEHEEREDGSSSDELVSVRTTPVRSPALRRESHGSPDEQERHFVEGLRLQNRSTWTGFLNRAPAAVAAESQQLNPMQVSGTHSVVESSQSADHRGLLAAVPNNVTCMQ